MQFLALVLKQKTTYPNFRIIDTKFVIIVVSKIRVCWRG